MLVYPENITKFRPEGEKVCPVCGEPYRVIQIDSVQNLVRVGCMEHFLHDGVIRVEPLKTIDGKPADKYPADVCSTAKSINGYEWL